MNYVCFEFALAFNFAYVFLVMLSLPLYSWLMPTVILHIKFLI